jgi:hypothetical protein
MDGGAAAWKALALRLAQGADDGTAEDIGIALALALPTNAPAALGAVDPKNGPILEDDRVCSAPFYEDTVKDPAAYKRQSLWRRGRRRPKAFGGQNACLNALKKVR